MRTGRSPSITPTQSLPVNKIDYLYCVCTHRNVQLMTGMRREDSGVQSTKETKKNFHAFQLMLIK